MKNKNYFLSAVLLSFSILLVSRVYGYESPWSYAKIAKDPAKREAMTSFLNDFIIGTASIESGTCYKATYPSASGLAKVPQDCPPGKVKCGGLTCCDPCPEGYESVIGGNADMTCRAKCPDGWVNAGAAGESCVTQGIDPTAAFGQASSAGLKAFGCTLSRFFEDDVGKPVKSFFEGDFKNFFEQDVKNFFEKDFVGFFNNDVKNFFEHDVACAFSWLPGVSCPSNVKKDPFYLSVINTIIKEQGVPYPKYGIVGCLPGKNIDFRQTKIKNIKELPAGFTFKVEQGINKLLYNNISKVEAKLGIGCTIKDSALNCLVYDSLDGKNCGGEIKFSLKGDVISPLGSIFPGNGKTAEDKAKLCQSRFDELFLMPSSSFQSNFIYDSTNKLDATTCVFLQKRDQPQGAFGPVLDTNFCMTREYVEGGNANGNEITGKLDLCKIKYSAPEGIDGTKILYSMIASLPKSVGLLRMGIDIILENGVYTFKDIDTSNFPDAQRGGKFGVSCYGPQWNGPKFETCIFFNSSSDCYVARVTNDRAVNSYMPQSNDSCKTLYNDTMRNLNNALAPGYFRFAAGLNQPTNVAKIAQLALQRNPGSIMACKSGVEDGRTLSDPNTVTCYSLDNNNCKATEYTADSNIYSIKAIVENTSSSICAQLNGKINDFASYFVNKSTNNVIAYIGLVDPIIKKDSSNNTIYEVEIKTYDGSKISSNDGIACYLNKVNNKYRTECIGFDYDYYKSQNTCYQISLVDGQNVLDLTNYKVPITDCLKQFNNIKSSKDFYFKAGNDYFTKSLVGENILFTKRSPPSCNCPGFKVGDFCVSKDEVCDQRYFSPGIKPYCLKKIITFFERHPTELYCANNEPPSFSGLCFDSCSNYGWNRRGSLGAGAAGAAGITASTGGLGAIFAPAVYVGATAISASSACWLDCNKNSFFPFECGDECAINNAACAGSVSNKVLSPVLAVVGAVITVASLGTATPAVQAARESATVAVDGTAKLAANMAVKATQKGLADAGVNAAVKTGEDAANIAAKATVMNVIKGIATGSGKEFVNQFGRTLAQNLGQQTFKTAAKEIVKNLVKTMIANLVSTGVQAGCMEAIKASGNSNKDLPYVCMASGFVAGGIAGVGVHAGSGYFGLSQELANTGGTAIFGVDGIKVALGQGSQVIGAEKQNIAKLILLTLSIDSIPRLLKFGLSIKDIEGCYSELNKLQDLNDFSNIMVKNCRSLSGVVETAEQKIANKLITPSMASNNATDLERISKKAWIANSNYKFPGYESENCTQQSSSLTPTCRILGLILAANSADEFKSFLSKNPSTTFDDKINGSGFSEYARYGIKFAESSSCLKGEQQPYCKLFGQIEAFGASNGNNKALVSLVSTTGFDNTAGEEIYNFSDDETVQLSAMDKAVCDSLNSGNTLVGGIKVNAKMCIVIIDALTKGLISDKLTDINKYADSLDMSNVTITDAESDEWELNLRLTDAKIETGKLLLQDERMQKIKNNINQVLQKNIKMNSANADEYASSLIEATADNIAAEFVNMSVKEIYQDPMFWGGVADPTGIVSIVGAYLGKICPVFAGPDNNNSPNTLFKSNLISYLPSKDELTKLSSYKAGVSKVIDSYKNNATIVDRWEDVKADWVARLTTEKFTMYSKKFIDAKTLDEWYWKLNNNVPTLYVYSFDRQLEIKASDIDGYTYNSFAYDCVGNDLSTPIFKGVTLQQCKEACNNEANCTGVSYNTKSCILKGNTIQSNCNKALASAQEPNTVDFPNDKDKFSFEPKVYDCSGGDISSSIGIGFADCSNLCATDKRCSGFSYNGNKCILKTGITNQNCSISYSNQTTSYDNFNYDCIADDKIISNISTKDRKDCENTCNVNTDCTGFSYNGDICFLKKQTLGNACPIDNIHGYKFFQKQTQFFKYYEKKPKVFTFHEKKPYNKVGAFYLNLSNPSNCQNNIEIADKATGRITRINLDKINLNKLLLDNAMKQKLIAANYNVSSIGLNPACYIESEVRENLAQNSEGVSAAIKPVSAPVVATTPLKTSNPTAGLVTSQVTVSKPITPALPLSIAVLDNKGTSMLYKRYNESNKDCIGNYLGKALVINSLRSSLGQINIDNNGVLSSNRIDLSLNACASYCVNAPDCVGVSYNPTVKMCALKKDFIYNSVKNCNAQNGYYYYHLEARDKTIMPKAKLEIDNGKGQKAIFKMYTDNKDCLGNGIGYMSVNRALQGTISRELIDVRGVLTMKNKDGISYCAGYCLKVSNCVGFSYNPKIKKCELKKDFSYGMVKDCNISNGYSYYHFEERDGSLKSNLYAVMIHIADNCANIRPL